MRISELSNQTNIRATQPIKGLRKVGSAQSRDVFSDPDNSPPEIPNTNIFEPSDTDLEPTKVENKAGDNKRSGTVDPHNTLVEKKAPKHISHLGLGVDILA